MKIEIAVRSKAFVVKVGSTNSEKVRDCDHHLQSLRVTYGVPSRGGPCHAKWDRIRLRKLLGMVEEILSTAQLHRYLLDVPSLMKSDTTVPTS